MWQKIILLYFLFNYLVINSEQELSKSQTNDSNALQNLYEKLEQNCRNPRELKAIKKLSQIICDIKSFESQLSEKKNSTQLKVGLIDDNTSNFITKVVVNISKLVDIKNFWNSIKEGISTALTCMVCQSIIQIIFSNIFGAETLAFAFINICYVLNLSDYDICEGYVTKFKDQVDYIRQNSKMEKMEMCGLIMGDQCYSGESLNIHWKLNITEKAENVGKSQNLGIKKQQKRKYNILHITDIHLDTDYVPNAQMECGTPYCCRKRRKNIEPNMSINYWGSYPCDTPLQTLDNWARHVDWDNVDWTYWTGDVLPHDSWSDSRSKSLQTSKVINNYFKTFSKKKIVVPAIGNHIAVPVNCFPPPLLKTDFDISWLYEDLAEQWSQWLPKEALDSVRFGGYYSLKIKAGLRIIVLNSNYCARLNIWTLYNSVDPADHLKWLISELDAAEKAGDLVHMVGHVPPDNRECTQSWLYNFLTIVERYSDTIVGQFYGHIHWDEFRVLYSVYNSSKPIGLEFIGPSLTTYDLVNPAYRIISCNKNGEILDLDTYAFNLEEANKGVKSVPKWYHEYSMAQTYSIDTFNAIQFDGLIKSIDSNEELLQTFYRLSHRNSSYVKTNCDKNCKSKFIGNTLIANPFHQKPKPLIQTIDNN